VYCSTYMTFYLYASHLSLLFKENGLVHMRDHNIMKPCTCYEFEACILEPRYLQCKPSTFVDVYYKMRTTIGSRRHTNQPWV